MRYRFSLPMIVLIASALILPTTVPAQDSSISAPVVRSGNELAIDLYRGFAEEKESFIFSPYSIYTALGMLYGGARGATAEQIRVTLRTHVEDEQFHAAVAALQAELAARAADGAVELNIANGLWPQEGYPFLESYIELMKAYNAEFEALDYQSNAERARDVINAWAAEQTNSRIMNLLEDPPYPTTVLILANAIYFKGNWNAQFDESNTRQEPFYRSDGQATEVPMMNQLQRFNYLEYDTAQVLEMPYIGEQLSMVIVLPGNDYTLESVEVLLTADRLDQWASDLWENLVDVHLPRFTMRSRFDLKGVLQSMGVTDVFTSGVADLSGIDGIPNWLVLGFALQKAFVDVNEEGAEAAAVTVGGGCFPAGTVVLTAGGPRPIEEISAGTMVSSFDWSHREWVFARVQGRTTTAYEGDMVTIQASGEQIETTGNHPFYVLRGAALNSRPEPLDVPLAERQTGSDGRWVAARDLRTGDLLMARDGSGAIVTGVSSQRRTLEVYNLTVENLHSYAVGESGLLVHNKGGAPEEPAEFRADRPFLFMIRDIPTGAILFMGRVGNPSDE